MNEKLKLFVWENVLCDYTPGIAFALAESVEEAKIEIAKSYKYLDDDTLKDDPDIYTSPIGFALSGGG